MRSMEKVWKQDMLYLIQEAFDPSLDEDDNYDRVLCDYDPEFTDPSNLDEEDIKQLGGSTKLAKRFEMYDDLSSEKQNEIWYKIEELIKDYGQMLIDEEEDWIRSKISKLLKTA